MRQIFVKDVSDLMFEELPEGAWQVTIPANRNSDAMQESEEHDLVMTLSDDLREEMLAAGTFYINFMSLLGPPEVVSITR